MARTVIGIDLGTTNSLVAVLQGGRPTVLENRIGEKLTPSAVSVDEDGSVLVGAAARARVATHPDRTVMSFKRDMGTARSFAIGKHTFRPEELSAMILAELRRDAEAQLGRTVDEAVVTVPAYFGELQRRATRDACEIASLPVERIINEPTAAALAFGLHEIDRELTAVVLDLGGGTFDVTVLEIIEGVVEIQASAGDAKLGGDDFVTAIEELVTRRITERAAAPRGPVAAARIREACELAKRRLSDAATTRVALVSLDTEDGERDVEVELSRDDVEDASASLLQRIRTPIRRALRDARQSPEAIDEVLLVGGATRMPCVRSLAAKVFGRLPRTDMQPDEAVALGAAVQAGLKAGDAAVEDMVVTDVAPFTLGVSTADRVGLQYIDGIFTPILERGTVLPASRSRPFSTLSHRQKSLVVEVYQGEHSQCRDNTKLGELKVGGIPAKAAGEESVDIRFSYDLNGLLEVDATVTSTGETSTLVIERSPGQLSPREVEKARKSLARLKFHPRDALPNRTALARADALFAELGGVERQALSEAIQAFRLELEHQDPERITSAREGLLQLVDALRR